jgi:hypothetical protein
VYINRAKALLLVGTISAGYACSDDEGSDTPGTAGTAGANTGGTSSAGSSGRGGTAGASSGGSAGQGGSGGTSGGSSQGGTAGASSGGSSGEGSPDAGAPDASDAGDAGNGDAGNPDASAPDGGDGGTLICDDTLGTIVDCTGLGEIDCSGEEAFLSVECEMLEFNLKPVPANAARNCMIALDPPDLCVEANTYTCITDALAASCPDPEADDECTAIGLVCDEQLPAFSACSAALSGMTQDGRNRMVDCMTQTACDLTACIEGLSF